MRWFAALTLRFFLGTLVGVVLFMLNVGLVLGELASSGASTVLAVVLPLALGWLAGFAAVEVWNAHRWNRVLFPLANGARSLNEIHREQLIKAGMREILGPTTLPVLIKPRLRLFLDEWSSTLLKLHCREEWVWDLYGMALPIIGDSNDVLAALQELLLAEDRPPEDAVRFGLELAEFAKVSDDLALMLAREGFRLGEDALSLQQRQVFDGLCTRAYRIDSSLSPMLLPYLVNRCMELRRTDEIAGRIYLDAVRSGEAIHGVKAEMRRIGRQLERQHRNEKLAAALLEAGGAEEEPAAEVYESRYEGDRAAYRVEEPEEVIAQPPVEDEFEAEAREEVPGFDVEPEAEEPELEEEEEESVATGFEAEAEPEPTPEALDHETIEDEGIEPYVQRTDRLAAVRKLLGHLQHWPKQRLVLVGSVIGAVVLLLVIIALIGRGPAPVEEEVASHLTPPGPYTSQQPYTVQVAAHRSEEAALRQTLQLRGLGVDAYLVKPSGEGSRFFRVRTGRFMVSDSARSVADSLKAAGMIEDYFVAPFEPGVVPRGSAPEPEKADVE